MIEGTFIVLEGVDGAGTTTHTEKLAQKLKECGLPVHATRQPSNGPIGMLLRQILIGRLIVPGMNGNRPPTWETMSLLFAADRADHLEAEIIPNLSDGVTVLCDRYDYSSAVYQSVTSGGGDEQLKWVQSLNKFARRPDLTVVLDIPADVAADRRRERMVGREMYDDDELQSVLSDSYRNLKEYYPQDSIVYVDANREVDVVAKDVWSHTSKKFGFE